MRRRNPVADHLLAVKLQYADAAQAERERKRRLILTGAIRIVIVAAFLKKP